MSAISKTVDSGGVLNTLLGKNREVLESNVKDALRSSRSLKETGIHGRPMLVEQLVNDSARTRSVVEGSMLDLRKEIVLSAFDGKERQLAERALLANDGALAHMSFRKPIQKLEGPLKPADRDRVRANIEDLVKKTNVEHSLDMDSTLREKLVNGLVETNRQDFLQMIRPGSANYRQDYRTRLKQRVSVMMDAVERAELQALKSKTKQDSFTVGDYITQNIRRQTTEQHGYFKDVKGSKSQEFRQQTFDNVKRIQAFSENVRRKFGEEAYKDFMGSAMDPHVFLRNKEIVDKRVVRHAAGSFTNAMAESFQVPFIGLRPFKMINLWDKENIQKMPRHVLYSAGQRAPTLAKDRLTESMVYANGSVFRYNAQSGSAEIVSDNMTMASSRLGSIAHTFSNMAGESRKSGEPYANLLAQWFDVGRQEYPSIFKRLLSAKDKYEDPNFILNVVGAAAQPGSVTAPTIRKAYNKTLSLLERNAAPIDSASMNALSGYLLQIPGMDPARLSGILGGTIENRAMKGLQEVLNIRGESRMPLINEKKLRRIRAEYMRDQDAFGAIRHVQSPGDEMDITPGLTELISSKERRLFTGFDEAERSSQIELLHLASSSSGIEVPEIVEQLLNSGKIGKKQARTIKDVWAYGELGKLSNDAGHLEDMFVGKMAGIFQNNGLTGNASALHDQIMDRVGRSSKWFTEGALDVPPNAFADNEFIPVRKAVNPLASINQVLKSGGNIDDIFDAIGKDLFGQLGFGSSKYRAGRQNMQNVTTLTHGTYFYLSRLSEGLGTLGLGLSRDKMGDTQQLAANLLGRRFILPLAGIAAVGYGNFLAGEALGEKPSQTLSATYANATIGMKAIKDITGLTGLSKRMSAIFPGSQHLFDNPVGGLVKYASLGLIGDDRNAKETLYDYEHGMDPVRKGRFWGWGSTTPYYGGRVEFHKPNWYRLEMGQPEMTDVLYGSEREYWSQHWLPTLHNPLGPLKRIIDPYHWERKHEKDRPYPVSGGVPELEQLPLVGPALAGTVGKLIKPTRKYPGLQRAHEEYLREINTRITDFVKTADSGALITVSPGGQVTPVELTGDLTSEVIGPQDGEQTQGAIRYVGGTGGSVSSMGIGYNGPGGGVSGMGRGGGMAVSQLRGQNNWIKAQNVKPIDGRSINLLRDAAYVDSLDQAVDPNSTRARLSETWYSMTEIGGIYGFAATALLGEFAPRTMLDSSSRMTSMERKWWDKRMGGLGGELSEIGRRFLPHKQNQIQRYNPIRNQMPDWMPGLEYMQDFKHGDPFVVLPYGESRLPGAGYEAINKLHPDVFGKYGALDRMRILADVAPWSEQFKYYSKVVSQMRAANMLSEEDTMLVEEARQMVSARKQKYELNPYRFVDAKIEKKKVTVTRIIDDTTFMTAEMPWAPIRLAGIKLSAKDTKSGVAEREMIREHIKVGQELQIGIDADYLNRIRDDTMGTIHAAVYDGYGDTLQRRLTHTIGSKVKTDMENPDPVATHALFTGFERGIGRGWERFAHLDTPIHCVAPFTQIITQDGAKEAASVEIGDVVLTHKGNFKPVLGVAPQPIGKDIYEIELSSSNIPLVVTFDHPILAVRAERKKRITSHSTGLKLEPYGINPTPEFIWAKDLRPYDYVVYKPRTMENLGSPVLDLSTLGTDRFAADNDLVYGKFRGGGKGKKIGKRFLEISGDVARLLGYYAAEGCVSGRTNRPTYTIFTFSSTETQYVDDVCRIVRGLGMSPRVADKGTVTVVTVGSSILAEFVSFYVGQKTEKKAPDALLTNKALRAEFVRGLLRGDGTKAGHERYDSIGMAAISVLLWTRDALFDLWGIAASVAIQAKRENTLYCLRIGTFGELANFVDGNEEYHSATFSQDIQTRVRCRVNDYILYRIQSVQLSEYQGETIDIEVEDDDTFATINADVHNTKFLQIRSPLEMYERNLIYGKEWRSWNHPFRDWVKPTLDRISTNSPIMAVGIGAMVGSMFSWKGKAKGIGALVGGALGGLGSMNRVLQESTGRLFGDRSAWVPKRVQKIREINEYFDALKYVKYKGLYEKTRQMAIEYEGIDPELIANYAGEGALKSKKARRALKEMKKGLKLAQNRDDIIGNETAKEKIKVLNQMENSYGKVAMEAGPLTLRALQYRKEYESTLMGADPSGDVQAIYAALPKSDRYFFKYFSTASPREREKILRLVPKNQRRFYQAQWGLPVEKAPTAQAVFSRHALPGQNWSGWRPDVSLESVKLKTIDHLGLDASDFGFMPDDLQEIPRTTPRAPAGAAIGGITIPNIPALMAVLAGKGIQDSDIRIEYTTTNDPMDRFGVSMDLRHDRRQDVNNEINRWVAMGSPV